MKRLLLLILLSSPLAHAQTSWVSAPAEASFAFAPSADAWLALAGWAAALAAEADAPLAMSIYPNPALDEATVRFSLERTQRVSLDLFDLLGRQVRQRDLGVMSAGEHEVMLDLRNLPAGLYIVRLSGDAGARATVRVTRAMKA